jgi:hypothetical protein
MRVNIANGRARHQQHVSQMVRRRMKDSTNEHEQSGLEIE